MMMTKYTIFCVLGLAMVIQGVKYWMTSPGNPDATTMRAGGEITPLTKTAHASTLAVPPTSGNDSPQAEPTPRLPAWSFTPGSEFLAQAAQATKQGDSAPAKTDAAPPSVLVTTTQPAPLVIKPTFVPQPHEANPVANSDPASNPNSVVVSKQESPLSEAAIDPADVRPRLPADATLIETTVESASMIAAATAGSSSLPDFATLKPLVDKRVLLQFPWTAQMQISLDDNQPIPPYGMGGNPAGTAVTNTQRLNEARNPAQVKADSRVSHNLLQGAQLAYQQPTFPEERKLIGKELTLQDLFILTNNREQRFALLKAYWKVALAMAEFHWAFEEFYNIEKLERVGNGRVSPSHIYIEAAIYSSLARVSETRTQAINAQYELLTLMGGKYRNLPLSVDVPLVGIYNTQYEANFPNGGSSKRLQAINKTIDNRCDTVNSRGVAINLTFKAWEAAIDLYRRDPSDQNAQVVALAYEQLTRHRRSFLGSIREYNTDIAEYALSVLSPSFRPDQMAGSLTRTPSPRPLWNTSAMISTDSLASQPAIAGGGSDPQVQPATFVEDQAGKEWSEKTRSLPSVMKQN